MDIVGAGGDARKSKKRVKRSSRAAFSKWAL